jgi:Uma2 family endonuclease
MKSMSERDPRLANLLRAEDLGVRLELVGGLPLWEAYPVYKHQKAVDRIRATIERGTEAGDCACIHAADVYIAFPDGSLKRPDISIFCREPEEDDEAVRMVPAAVVEVVSKGFEAKDLEIGPRFYLSQGVLDVVVYDPSTLLVLHVTKDSARRLLSPVEIDLLCGCRLEV